MKRIGAGAFALLAVALSTSTAVAQVCIGFPTVDRQFSFGASLGFPDGGDRYGVEASYNVQGPFAVYGGLQIDSPEGDADDRDTYYGGAAFDLLRVGLGAGADSLGICPTVRVGYTSVDSGSYLTVPIGVGLGTRVAVGDAAYLMPYVVPELVWARFSPDDGDSTSDSDFAIRGGAAVGFGMFFIGGEVSHPFQDGAQTVFGIRVGIVP